MRKLNLSCVRENDPPFRVLRGFEFHVFVFRLYSLFMICNSNTLHTHFISFYLFCLMQSFLFKNAVCLNKMHRTAQHRTHTTASANNCFVFIANAIQDKSHLFDMRGSSFVNKSIWLPFKINK